MKKSIVLLLAALLLMGFALNSFAEMGMNSFMGSSPEQKEVIKYHPKSTAALGELVNLTDSLVYYFYRPTCKYCSERADMIMAGLPDIITLPDGEKSTLKVIALNKSDPSEETIIRRYYEQNEISEDKQLVPSIIIGDQYLCGVEAIRNDFLKLLLMGEGLKTPYIDQRMREMP